MSTNKTPVHMRLYTLGFWYSRNRRNGQSRIQAFRSALQWLKPVTITTPTIASLQACGVLVGSVNIQSPTIVGSEIAARIEVLQPKPGDMLVFSFPRVLDAVQRERIEKSVWPFVPDGVKMMVLDGGASVAHVAAPAAKP